MAKKDYFLLVDTETTQDFKAKFNGKGEEIKPKIPAYVADFGAIVCDRKGQIYAQCAVMVHGIFGEFPLFFSPDPKDQVFGKHTLDRRMIKYQAMLESGSRSLASIGAINRWLENVNGKYEPILTAYNLSFDTGKCRNTDIDLSIFSKRFCLMKSAQDKWAHKKDYLQMVLDTHSFNNRKKSGRMSFQTKAEIMAKYVLGNPDLEAEPHTSLEDVIDYELPILVKLVNSTKKEKWMNPNGINYHKQQVKDYFKPK